MQWGYHGTMAALETDWALRVRLIRLTKRGRTMPSLERHPKLITVRAQANAT